MARRGLSDTLSSGSAPRARLPGGVWAMGFASLLMDTASELVHSLLPLFMSVVLGAGMATIGLVEGVAEGTAAITKLFSGALSDRLGRRKPLMLAGYGLAAATKPLFPLAGGIGTVFTARFLDRVGKGIRGAPRDALVAEITPAELRGSAYGLRQALDSVGAFLGPVLAIVLMARLADDVRAVLWVAVVPAVLCVVVLAVAVREPRAPAEAARRARTTLADARLLPRPFWLVLGLAALFTLARFSEAFIVLRANDVGLPLGLVPAVLVLMNVVYAGSAYPAGRAADRLSPRVLLAGGLAALLAADAALAAARAPAAAFAGAALWGLHLGLTQGLLAKLVADAAPAALRGTAFGWFHLVSGVSLLVASLLAGALWSARGPAATFVAGAVFAALAMGSLLVWKPRLHS